MPSPLPADLADLQKEIEGYAHDYGLDPIRTIFEVLDYDEMNEIAAYGGFPTRYPHWRHGMEYEGLARGYQYGLQKIYEMVINNDPCHAYLLRCNAAVDQKIVMAHVMGHSDFFKNNLWFSQTDRKMVDTMANHGTRVRRYIERYGEENVETFVDACLSIENLIDPHSVYSPQRRRPAFVIEPEEPAETPRRLASSKEYMDRYMNPPDFMDRQQKKIEDAKRKKRNFPESIEKDVLYFLMQYAPLENWQRDVLSIVREEAYYFAPQAMTKIMNEGWACVEPQTLVFSDVGVVSMRELTEREAPGVSDGERRRAVYDRHVVRGHEVVRMRTRRGLFLGGSTTHRILRADGKTWVRMDELRRGDRIAVSGGRGLWATETVRLAWHAPSRVGLQDVAEKAGVSVWTVLRHRAGRHVRESEAVSTALETYDSDANLSLPQSLRNRAPVRIPSVLDESLGAFLGYLVGDGHVSRVKRHLGLTTGDLAQAHAFRRLAQGLFETTPSLRRDGGRWRVLIHSETVSDFLVQTFGITEGPSAREKRIPAAVLRSPEPVVRSFLRAYFDCDGYAGKQGVILSTSSPTLAEQVQLLLLNFGILSRRRPQRDGCWHVHATGQSARVFADCIGFGLIRKQRALKAYLKGHRWYKTERWEDEVVSLERGRADVYDISVEETHRYAAAGFINHNSYWHSTIMTQKAMNDSEVIDFADHHSGTMGMRPGSINPYKVGIELYRDIEDRWNKGRFGPEWDQCHDVDQRRLWDKKLGIGRQKIFEVRKIYNDVTFIDAFLTKEFCIEHKMFVYTLNPQTNKYEISNRDFSEIKKQFLFRLTNMGQPFIVVKDGNYANRGELLLSHLHEGFDLEIREARETLRNVHRVWQRPVHIETQIEEEKKIFSFDGEKHRDMTVEST